MADVNLQLTTAGQVLNAKIQQGLGTIPLEITRIVTAAGHSDDPLNLPGVVDERQQFDIISRTVVSTRAIIAAFLANYGNPVTGLPPLTQGYPLQQIGFYAIDPDDGEILYRISQFENPNWVPSFNERGWEYKPTFNFSAGNASEVIIEINPSGLATVEMLQDHIDDTIFSPEGVHGIRFHGGFLQGFDGAEWINIATTPGPNRTSGVLGAGTLGAAILGSR